MMVGCREGSWISSLVRRPDRMYSDEHEFCSSCVGAVQRVSKFGNWGRRLFVILLYVIHFFVSWLIFSLFALLFNTLT
jgi:hypothetical protein